jgi:hypothetical protein
MKKNGKQKTKKILHNCAFGASIKYVDHPIKFHNENLELKFSSSPGELPYEETKDVGFSSFHWGQRKLFLSEVEFLTEFLPKYQKIKAIIYAGGASGIHIPFLFDLIDPIHEMDWILIDPAPFFKTVHKLSKQQKEQGKGEKVKIINAFMTNALATTFKAKYGVQTLFVSDIRRSTKDPDVLRDLNEQADWIKIMQSRVSLLKFRFPWSIDKMKYLKGEIFKPIWGKQQTAESRLIIDCKDKFKEKMWDCRKYERMMFYHNIVERQQYYPHEIEIEGLCHCFDCSAEVKIWKDFIGLVKKTITFKGKEEEFIQKLINKLTETLGASSLLDKYFEKYPDIKKNLISLIKTTEKMIKS